MSLRDIPSLDNTGFISTLMAVQVITTDDQLPSTDEFYLRPAPNTGDRYKNLAGDFYIIP